MDELIEKAKQLISAHYKQGVHHVSCVLKTESGKYFDGIHIESQKVDICAEWVAVGKAILEDDDEIIQIVAVKKFETGELKVLPPCSLCRDLLIRYAPNAQVGISEKEQRSAKELFPDY